MANKQPTPTQLAARQLGQDAFNNGVPRQPNADSRLAALLATVPTSPDGIELMRQWLTGWDIENVSAPLPDEEPVILTTYEQAFEYGKAAYRFGLVRGADRDGKFTQWQKAQPDAIHILLAGEWQKGWDEQERIAGEADGALPAKQPEPHTWTLTISQQGQPDQKMTYPSQDGAIIGAITYLNRQFSALRNEKEVDLNRLSAEFSIALTNIVQWTNPRTAFDYVLYTIE